MLVAICDAFASEAVHILVVDFLLGVLWLIFFYIGGINPHRHLLIYRLLRLHILIVISVIFWSLIHFLSYYRHWDYVFLNQLSILVDLFLLFWLAILLSHHRLLGWNFMCIYYHFRDCWDGHRGLTLFQILKVTRHLRRTDWCPSFILVNLKCVVTGFRNRMETQCRLFSGFLLWYWFGLPVMLRRFWNQVAIGSAVVWGADGGAVLVVSELGGWSLLFLSSDVNYSSLRLGRHVATSIRCLNSSTIIYTILG